MSRATTTSSIIGLAVLSSMALWSARCGAHLPPADVPAPARADLQPFRDALKAYLDATQPYRRSAAAEASSVPNQTRSSIDSVEAVRLRERTIADAIRTKVRPTAARGQIFSAQTSAILKRDLDAAFRSPRADLIRDELKEQNEGDANAGQPPHVNESLKAPLLPPLLVSALPQLPEQVEYDFTGRALVLRDVDADIVVDYLPDAMPEQPSEPPEPPPSTATTTSRPMLGMPDLPGGTVFVAMGDSGSGDRAQYAVAETLTRYFNTAHHFEFVIMLGDNLYHDDYESEFLTPYKTLLDKGVSFYAALGNHDRDLEEHFKPFNMGDRPYYAFTKGNVRFVVLNSNRPSDAAQLQWLDNDAFGDTGNKWRIAYFHHPLYSSGEHAEESREEIRPALEPHLVHDHVDVVFGGHEHLYERVAPQQGIHYFVSGGGGKTLYDVHPSVFDQVAASAHHFMVVEVAGDAMLYEAVTPEGPLLDCGVIWRTKDAEAKGPDATQQGWLRTCAADTLKPSRTTNGR